MNSNRDKQRRGQKRTIDYDAVHTYAMANPTLTQDALAAHFGTSQSAISKALCQAGLHRVRGRKPKGDDWEQRLHDAGLGMDRGLRVGNDRIFYGQDYDRI
jgi:hypothetical protein